MSCLPVIVRAGERIQTALFPVAVDPDEGSLDRTDTGRSALVAGTDLHAPQLPFAMPAGIGSIGWKAAIQWRKSIYSRYTLAARIIFWGGETMLC